MPDKKGKKMGWANTVLARVPRTANNDDLYAPSVPDRVLSLDDLVVAVEAARNEKVICQGELAKAEQLEEDMEDRLSAAIKERLPNCTVTISRGRK